MSGAADKSAGKERDDGRELWMESAEKERDCFLIRNLMMKMTGLQIVDLFFLFQEKFSKTTYIHTLSG